MRINKENFKEGLLYLEFDQLKVILNALKVDMVDREKTKENTKSRLLKENPDMDFTNYSIALATTKEDVVFRRDFEKMMEECYEHYLQINRANRRMLNKLLTTIVNSNEKVRATMRRGAGVNDNE